MMLDEFKIYLENESKLHKYLLNLKQKLPNKKTHTKGLGDWKEWTEFIPTYSIKNDPFLQRFKSDEGYQINDVFQAYLVKYRADSFGMIISG